MSSNAFTFSVPSAAGAASEAANDNSHDNSHHRSHHQGHGAGSSGCVCGVEIDPILPDSPLSTATIDRILQRAIVLLFQKLVAGHENDGKYIIGANRHAQKIIMTIIQLVVEHQCSPHDPTDGLGKYPLFRLNTPVMMTETVQFLVDPTLMPEVCCKLRACLFVNGGKPVHTFSAEFSKTISRFPIISGLNGFILHLGWPAMDDFHQAVIEDPNLWSLQTSTDFGILFDLLSGAQILVNLFGSLTVLPVDVFLPTDGDFVLRETLMLYAEHCEHADGNTPLLDFLLTGPGRYTALRAAVGGGHPGGE